MLADRARRSMSVDQSALAERLEDLSYLRDAGDSVVAGGSLAFGLGNNLSDLDVVVAGPASFQSTYVPLEHFVKTLRVDVMKLSQKAIDEIFINAQAALSADMPLQGSFGDVDHENDLKLLHRIAY